MHLLTLKFSCGWLGFFTWLWVLVVALVQTADDDSDVSLFAGAKDDDNTWFSLGFDQITHSRLTRLWTGGSVANLGQ